MRIVLMYSHAPPTRGHLDRLGGLDPALEIVPVSTEAEARAAVARAEVILGHRYLRQSLPYADALRWVQTSAQGVWRLPLTELARRGVMLSRSTVDADSVAAHAIALAWSLCRAIPQSMHQQTARLWRQKLEFLPLPERALVLGYGSIGRAIAKRLAGQGIAVTCGVSNASARERASCGAKIVHENMWRRALPTFDWCLLALPSLPDTVGLFDEPALRSLPSHAIVVNVGFGGSLDTGALLRVMDSGHLGGAALDVLPREPLAREDPLWRHPRILITPHVASHRPERQAAVEHFFEAQLGRYLAGQPLEDLVDLRSAASIEQMAQEFI